MNSSRRLPRSLALGLLVAVFLLGLDGVQRYVYVSGAKWPLARGPWSSAGTHALLVSGPILDSTELATCRRDLASVDGSLFHVYGDKLRTQILAPPESARQIEVALTASRPDEELVVFLSGHGGGRNFGCGRFNIDSRELARILSGARYRHLLLVIDCCWSGQLLQELKGQLRNADIVSSTDASHEAPFASSFLGLVSYGPAFFCELIGGSGPAASCEQVNRERARWSWLYPAAIGTQGLHAQS